MPPWLTGAVIEAAEQGDELRRHRDGVGMLGDFQQGAVDIEKEGMALGGSGNRRPVGRGP